MLKPAFKILLITCALIVINYRDIVCNAHILGKAIHLKIVKRSSDLVVKRNITKPVGMPNDIYSKLVEDSKKLSEKDVEEFWQKAKNWWKDTMQKTGEFFRKIGNLFSELFKKSNNANEDIPSFTVSSDIEVITTPTIGRQDTNKDDSNFLPTNTEVITVKTVTPTTVTPTTFTPTTVTPTTVTVNDGSTIN